MSLPRSILVATDFSPHAEAALHMAAELALACGAKVRIAHVYDVTPLVLPEAPALYNSATIEQTIADCHTALDAAKAKLKALGVADVEAVLLQGAPAVELVRQANDQRVELLIMGTHGRTGMAHLVLGSVAERVVRKAPCPVITVPLAPPSAA
jgi:nucleotide-binding universal stress UspA family protein